MHENRPDSAPPAEEPLSQSLSFAGLTDFLGRPAEAESDDLPSGAVVGDVRILRFVGAGGMGRVYEGVQDTTQRTVAVKVMRPGIVSAAAARRLIMSVMGSGVGPTRATRSLARVERRRADGGTEPPPVY